MTVFMISLIVVAYSVLLFLVIKCKSLINRTCESGQTCRDLISSHKSRGDNV